MNNCELKIKIPNIDIQNLSKNEQLLAELLNSNHRQELQEYILDGLGNKDGGPQATLFKVKNFFYNQGERKGAFRLTFIVQRRYCCSDTESCQEDYLDFDFVIDNDILVAHTIYFDWSLNN